MLEFRPIQFGKSLCDNAKAVVLATKDADFFRKGFCFIEGIDACGNVRKGECTSILPDDADAGIGILDVWQMFFDRGGMKTKLKLEAGIFFKEE